MLETGPASGVRPASIGLDAVDVPARPVDGPVDVGLREPPGLADLADEQQGEQFAMLGEGVEGGGDAGAAFGQRDVAPGAVLVERGADGLVGGGRVEAGRAGDRAAVDGAGGGAGGGRRPASGCPRG